MFDEAKIHVRSGDGGAGIVAFRREKHVPKGGPSGGDGGRGGDIILRVNKRVHTLRRFSRQRHFHADAGGRGGSSRKTGASAAPLYIDVPPGTVVFSETGEKLADLINEGAEWYAAKGGRGGRGNCRFVNAQQQTPRMAEKGAPGESRWLQLELRLLADIGIVGLPNAGKSTLLSVISHAKPKIANYPFTTLEPNLGVLMQTDQELIIADIPGLVEGANQGVGLGHTFLRHLKRTRLLIHLIDGSQPNVMDNYALINMELALFSDELREKPQIVVVNKYDLANTRAFWPHLSEEFAAKGIEPLVISAATQQGVNALTKRLFAQYAALPALESNQQETIFTIADEPDEPIFSIHRKRDGEYIVCGKNIERAASMTYWENEESVNHFQKILAAFGITTALSNHGIQLGDIVHIGTHELEWDE